MPRKCIRSLWWRSLSAKLSANPRASRAASAGSVRPGIGTRIALPCSVGASADPFAFPELASLTARLDDPAIAVIEGGMVPLMELHSIEVADLIARFAL